MTNTTTDIRVGVVPKPKATVAQVPRVPRQLVQARQARPRSCRHAAQLAIVDVVLGVHERSRAVAVRAIPAVVAHGGLAVVAHLPPHRPQLRTHPLAFSSATTGLRTSVAWVLLLGGALGSSHSSQCGRRQSRVV